MLRSFQCGEVAEWLKAHAWNACMRETVSRVRIPLSPPLSFSIDSFPNFFMIFQRFTALLPVTSKTRMGMSMGMFMGMLGKRTQKYCRLRGRTYYGRIAVPLALREAYGGKQVIEQSLGTRDYAEAMARLGLWLQQRRAEFDAVERELSRPRTEVSRISVAELERLRELRAWNIHQQLRANPVRGPKEIEQRLTGTGSGPAYFEDAGRIAREKGLTWSDPSELLDMVFELHEGDETALALYNKGHTPLEPVDPLESPDLCEHLEAWLSEQRINAKTRAEYRSIVGGLHQWLVAGTRPTSMLDISRKVAGEHVTHLAEINVRTTAKKKISALSTYWKWLNGKGLASVENVWADQPFPKVYKGSENDDDEPNKRPFTDEEVRILLDGITNQPLADMIRIAALSGMTVNEIACLKVGNCRDGTMTVRTAFAKTKSRKRNVPIHSDLRDMIKRRMQGKTEENWLFDEIKDSPNEALNRGSAVSKAFTRARRKLGVHDHPEHLEKSRVEFHSFRRWFTTKAMQAIEKGMKDGKAVGFSKYTVDDVTGHVRDKRDMTGGVYQGPSTPEAMRACVEAVKLPTSG
jgi:integrase